MQDETEAIIRETLSHYPRPSASPNAVADIVALSLRGESSRRGLPIWMKRGVLSGYWLSAFVATIAILSSVPLPEWRPSGLTTLAAWVVPVCGVLALCFDSIVATLLKWRERYLRSQLA